MAIQRKSATPQEAATPVAKKRAIGFLNPIVKLKSGGEMRLNGISVFSEGQYTDKEAIWLVNYAERNGGEVTIPMEVTIRVNKEKQMPIDAEVPTV